MRRAGQGAPVLRVARSLRAAADYGPMTGSLSDLTGKDILEIR
jgi:hypothetical protein